MSIIALTGVVMAIIGWWAARILVPEDFTGIVSLFAGVIGLWSGMLAGLLFARTLFAKKRGDNGLESNP